MGMTHWATAAAVVLAGLLHSPLALAQSPSALIALAPQPAGEAWPTRAWTRSAPRGADPAAIAAAADAIMAAPHPELGETRALVIIQDGRLVFDRYAEGYTAKTRHVSWSAAKSITHALVGVAALEGRLNPDAPMGHPLWPSGQGFAQVTWRQWLQMTDGQDWTEVDARTILENGSAQALFGPGRLDVDRFCAQRPVRTRPGQSFRYNTCGITLAAGGLGRLIAPQQAPDQRRAALAAWMRERLFGPIGMASAVPEFDAQGTFLGGSLVYATAEDFARFGYLYLRDGVWENRRILPAGWVDFARFPQPAKETDTYGAGFWITPPTGDGVGWRSLIVGEGLRDAFSAQGRFGQVVLIVPSKDLVIVRLGQFSGDSGKSWDILGDWMGALARQFPDRPALSQPGPESR
jgi:CubicO group peptidase (beta-lactamase class C family)